MVVSNADDNHSVSLLRNSEIFRSNEKV